MAIMCKLQLLIKLWQWIQNYRSKEKLRSIQDPSESWVLKGPLESWVLVFRYANSFTVDTLTISFFNIIASRELLII